MAAREGSEKSTGQRIFFQGMGIGALLPPSIRRRGGPASAAVGEELQQGPLRPVQALLARQLLDVAQVPTDHPAAAEPRDDGREHIGSAAHGGVLPRQAAVTLTPAATTRLRSVRPGITSPAWRASSQAQMSV